MVTGERRMIPAAGNGMTRESSMVVVVEKVGGGGYTGEEGCANILISPFKPPPCGGSHFKLRPLAVRAEALRSVR